MKTGFKILIVALASLLMGCTLTPSNKRKKIHHHPFFFMEYQGREPASVTDHFKILKGGCDRGHPEKCHALGALEYRRGHVSESRKYLRKACKQSQKRHRACQDLEKIH